MKRPRQALVLVLAAAWLLGSPARGGLPPEDECPTLTGAGGPGASEDAAPLVLKPGMVFRQSDLLTLRKLFPDEIWRHRQQFFFEGMALEIGPCHRRFSVPRSFREATSRFAPAVRIDGEGNLRDYVAGLPFPAEQIDPAAPDAATRWAWNLELRYRGAGFFGDFRLTDLPGGLGSVEVYRGSFFFLQTRHRADLEADDHTVSQGKGDLWAAGGRFDEPFNVRHLAWRQFRPKEAMTNYRAPDNTFVYVPTMRKARRSATSWVDGVFLPRYATSGDAGGGGIGVGIGAYGGGASLNPTAGESIQTSEFVRRGFTGMALRPNAYVWRLRGEQAVLAPLNGARKGYPLNPERNFGPSGLSVASDRWDVRQAVVIEGATRVREEHARTLTVWIDYQTQQPLYVIVRGARRRLLDIGILVHRFSGDYAGYPEWPGGGQALVFDPVAAAFFDAGVGAGGWRRESYGSLAVPPDSDSIRRMTSSDFLLRGR